MFNASIIFCAIHYEVVAVNFTHSYLLDMIYLVLFSLDNGQYIFK